MWPFQAFIEFVTILFLFYILVLFLFWPQSKWNLSFLTRDQTCTSCVGRWSVNPWTTSSVQFSRSGVSDSLRPPWSAARQASLSITNSQSSPKLMSIELVMPSSHLILCRPLPPALNPSQHQGLFQWVNSLHEVVRVLEFQLQHQSFQWTPRTDLL